MTETTSLDCQDMKVILRKGENCIQIDIEKDGKVDCVGWIWARDCGMSLALGTKIRTEFL